MLKANDISRLKRPVCHWVNAIDPIAANAGTSIMRIGEAVRAGVRKVAYFQKLTPNTCSSEN